MYISELTELLIIVVIIFLSVYSFKASIKLKDLDRYMESSLLVTANTEKKKTNAIYVYITPIEYLNWINDNENIELHNDDTDSSLCNNKSMVLMYYRDLSQSVLEDTLTLGSEGYDPETTNIEIMLIGWLFCEFYSYEVKENGDYELSFMDQFKFDELSDFIRSRKEATE